jgi:hypothetical protein
MRIIADLVIIAACLTATVGYVNHNLALAVLCWIGI